MTNRRGFIAALMAAPLAAKRAVSKVVHGQVAPRDFVEWKPNPVQQKIIRELWVNCESPWGVLVSIDGEPWRKIWAAQSPVIPLRIDLPPWVTDRMPKITLQAATDEPFKIYSWGVKGMVPGPKSNVEFMERG